MYNILVFISKSFLQALYLKGETISPISIDGNKKIKYSTENDFYRLISAIKDTFNVDELSQADLSVVIVDCGAESKNVECLYKEFLSIREHSVIKAEIIIPYVIQDSKLTNEDVIIFSILDEYFSITTKDNRCICSHAEKANNAIPLDVESFSILFNPKLTDSLTSSISKKEMEQSALKDKKIQELEDRLDKLEKEKNELQLFKDNSLGEIQRIEDYKNTITNLTKEIDDNKKKNESLNLKSERKLVTLTFYDNDLKSDVDSFRLSGYWNNDLCKSYPLVFKELEMNRSIVTKGEPILEGIIADRGISSEGTTLEVISGIRQMPDLLKTVSIASNLSPELIEAIAITQNNIITKQVVAPSSGKLFLFNSACYLLPIFKFRCSHWGRTVYHSADIAVGVIINKEDPADENEIEKWFQSQKESNFPSCLKDHCSNCFYRGPKYSNCEKKKDFCDSERSLYMIKEVKVKDN